MQYLLKEKRNFNLGGQSMKKLIVKNFVICLALMLTTTVSAMDFYVFPYLLYIKDVDENSQEEIQQLLEPNNLNLKLYLAIAHKRIHAHRLLIKHIAKLETAPDIYHKTLNLAICSKQNDDCGSTLLTEKSTSKAFLLKYFADTKHSADFATIFIATTKHRCKQTLFKLLEINKELNGTLITKETALNGLEESINNESSKMTAALLLDPFLRKFFTPTSVEEIFQTTVKDYCEFAISLFLLFKLFNETTAQLAYTALLETDNPKFIDLILSDAYFRKLLLKSPSRNISACNKRSIISFILIGDIKRFLYITSTKTFQPVTTSLVI
jgi:hypothetical protein